MKDQVVVLYLVDQGMEFEIKFSDPSRYLKAIAYLNVTLGKRSDGTAQAVDIGKTHPTYALTSDEYQEFKRGLE